MNKNFLRITVFAFSTFLFTLWAFLLHINWEFIQNTRMSDPLWLVNGVSPWLYAIVLVYVLLFFIILKYEVREKVIHIIFIIYLVLIIDLTPYFLSGFYRFPDTYNVAHDTIILPDILSHWTYVPYAQSFPSSYMLFYIVNLLTGIDLFSFARYVFSPLILVSIFVIWYLLVTRLFDSRVALISTMVAIPSQIVEISITPNSLAIVLTLISLFLCILDKWNSRVPYLIAVVSLVLAHAINPIVLFVTISFFYIYARVSKLNIINITSTNIYGLLVIWTTWILSQSCIMGNGIVKNICRILLMENKNLEQTSTYTAGSGGLAANYSWIQTLNMYKYELYGLVLAILIAYDLYFVGFYALKTSKRYLLKDPKLIKKYSFLFLGNIFSVITLSTLIFSGSDAQNIISRTLNYSMLFISLFIALSFNSLNISSNSLSKIINMFFIVFLLVTFITYPLYSYGRDSYINYPVSHEFGSNFYKSHISEGDSHMLSYSKAADFYQLMEGKNYGKNTNSTIYVNGWYTVYNLDIVNPKDNQNQNQRLDLM